MVIATQLPVATSKAFCPGHITGFFAYDEQQSYLPPIFRGSCGAGFSIDKGILTTVRIYSDSNKNYEIKIDGSTMVDSFVSKYVVERYLRMYSKPVFVAVEHETEIPIGYGLGSSGAAALGLSYALNESLNLGLSQIQSAQIAHEADVICKTGLGTVISEFTGGFELRHRVGGPGIGKISKIPISEEYLAVILCIKPVSTINSLDNKKLNNNKKEEINKIGKRNIKKFSHEKNINTFLNLSFDFAKEYGITDGYCKMPLQLLQNSGYKCSVALFGDTVFTLVKKNDIFGVLEIMKHFDGKLLVCSIPDIGAYLVNP